MKRGLKFLAKGLDEYAVVIIGSGIPAMSAAIACSEHQVNTLWLAHSLHPLRPYFATSQAAQRTMLSQGGLRTDRGIPEGARMMKLNPKEELAIHELHYLGSCLPNLFDEATTVFFRFYQNELENHFRGVSEPLLQEALCRHIAGSRSVTVAEGMYPPRRRVDSWEFQGDSSRLQALHTTSHQRIEAQYFVFAADCITQAHLEYRPQELFRFDLDSLLQTHQIAPHLSHAQKIAALHDSLYTTDRNSYRTDLHNFLRARSIDLRHRIIESTDFQAESHTSKHVQGSLQSQGGTARVASDGPAQNQGGTSRDSSDYSLPRPQWLCENLTAKAVEQLLARGFLKRANFVQKEPVFFKADFDWHRFPIQPKYAVPRALGVGELSAPQKNCPNQPQKQLSPFMTRSSGADSAWKHFPNLQRVHMTHVLERAGSQVGSVHPLELGEGVNRNMLMPISDDFFVLMLGTLPSPPLYQALNYSLFTGFDTDFSFYPSKKIWAEVLDFPKSASSMFCDKSSLEQFLATENLFWVQQEYDDYSRHEAAIAGYFAGANAARACQHKALLHVSPHETAIGRYIFRKEWERYSSSLIYEETPFRMLPHFESDPRFAAPAHRLKQEQTRLARLEASLSMFELPKGSRAKWLAKKVQLFPPILFNRGRTLVNLLQKNRLLRLQDLASNLPHLSSGHLSPNLMAVLESRLRRNKLSAASPPATATKE